MVPQLSVLSFFITIVIVEAKWWETRAKNILSDQFGKPIAQRKREWAVDCGCNGTDFPEVLVVSSKPVRNVCMINGYPNRRITWWE